MNTNEEKELTIDALANEIRRVDGGNTLGAGALAEAIMPFIRAALRAESEPVGWLVKFTDKSQHYYQQKELADYMSHLGYSPIPLYTAPRIEINHETKECK